jgi:hypothetical protein
MSKDVFPVADFYYNKYIVHYATMQAKSLMILKKTISPAPILMAYAWLTIKTKNAEILQVDFKAESFYFTAKLHR